MSWKPVTKDKPCPACGKPDWCAWTPDGDVLRCMRPGTSPQGMRETGRDANGGTRFAFADNGTTKRSHRQHRTPKPPSEKSPTPRFDLKAKLESYQHQLTDESLAELARITGICADGWKAVRPGWCTAADLRELKAGGAGWSERFPDGAWCFPEYDGRGQLIGLSLRTIDGRKGSPSKKVTGCGRGLVVPDGLHTAKGPILVVEGASDVAACSALGVPAVGRPSNRAGASQVADQLTGCEIIVVGERDAKPGGAWPGRDGAKAVAEQIAGRWGDPITWTLPPDGCKDIRDWIAANPDGTGDALRAALSDHERDAKPVKRSVADALVDLALKRYRLGRTEDGEPFAVDLEGPSVAIMLRGSATSLRAALSKAYREVTGRTPSASSLGDAVLALHGIAAEAEPESVALRLASHEDGVVLDLGDSSGRAILITADDWRAADTSPVLFRRTALSGALPSPEPGTSPDTLLELRDVLNVRDDAWPLVVGWLVASLIPNIPHPVLMFGGEQGTGKSTAARFILSLIDPSPAPLRSEPRDAESWVMTASGSWIVTIDNVSRISNWWSDAICKAVTGDGWVRRMLYTDSDLVVLAFRRCIMLTSIDAGSLRGDLGDRLLLVDLERIDERSRRTESVLERAYQDMRPRVIGALLSVFSRVLSVRPSIELDTLPRMADFAYVLAAIDQACPELTGGRAFELFVGQRNRIARDVIDADEVASAVVTFIESRDGAWSGTATELLCAITPDNPPKVWPKTPRGLSGRLKRIAPALQQLGITHTPPDQSDKSRTHRLEMTRVQPPEPPEQPETGVSSPSASSSSGGMGGLGGRNPVNSRRAERGDEATRSTLADLLRQARTVDPELATSMREAYYERIAMCTVDETFSDGAAAAIALKEVKAMLHCEGRSLYD